MVLLDDNFVSDHGNFNDTNTAGGVISYEGGTKVFDKTAGADGYNTFGHAEKDVFVSKRGMMWTYDFSVETNMVGEITDTTKSFWEMGLTGNPNLFDPVTGLVCNAGKFSYSEAGAGPQINIPIVLKRVYRLIIDIDSNGAMATYLRGPGFRPVVLIGVIPSDMTGRDMRMHFNMYSKDIVRLHRCRITDLE